MTFWFMDDAPTYSATPARADYAFIILTDLFKSVWFSVTHGLCVFTCVNINSYAESAFFLEKFI